MKAHLTILGSNSALPAQGRYPSAQVLHFHDQSFLIDCGEGTQLRLSQFGIKRSKINSIFISHLHGDHIYGLPGLITSYNHYQRHSPLTIYGPEGLKKFVEYSVFVTGNPLLFELHIHEFDPDIPQVLIDSDWINVKTIPLKHRIPTAGYLIELKNPNLKIKPNVFEKFNVPKKERKSIQLGSDFIGIDGTVFPNALFTEPVAEPIRYAYLSDTAYDPDLVRIIRKFHTIYHEATFLSDLKHKAIETKHSTAAQAAQIAHDAQVGRLIIGHFSSRYTDLEPLLDEAQAVFSNTELAIEGRQFDL